MLTNIDVCNAALGRLGAASISALNDGSVEAGQCNANLDISRRALLRMHPWKFAKSLTVLTAKFIQNVNLVVGSTYVIKDNTGMDVTNVGAQSNNNGQTFVATGTTPTAWGTGALWVAPAFGWAYQFDLPADYVRILKVDDGDTDYEKVGKQILCDSTTINLSYLYDCSNFDMMDSQFIDCLAHKLAINMCVKLTNSSNLKTELETELKTLLPSARFTDSTEGTPDSVEPQEWMSARRGTGGYVRDPRT